MENKNQQEEFRFTYSAKEQEEIKRIRERYTEQKENQFDQLRRLDRSASQKAQAVSISIGIVGALMLGFAMSLIMSELGSILGLSGVMLFLVAIPIGILGAGLVCLAYPVYEWVLKRERKKLAPIILRLSDELLK